MMPNPLTFIPPRVRGWLYIVFGAGGIVLLYTGAKDWTGQDELELWTGLGIFFGATSASNVGQAPDAGDPVAVPPADPDPDLDGGQ